MVHRVFREWISLRRLGNDPSINELNPKTFTSEWSWCFLARRVVKDRPDTHDLVLEFVGKSLFSDLATREERLDLGTISSQSLLGHAMRPLQWLFNEGTPAIVQDAGADSRARIWMYRTISLPFLDSRENLTYAFGAFSGMLADTQVAADIRSAETGAFIYKGGAWIRVEEEVGFTRPAAVFPRFSAEFS